MLKYLVIGALIVLVLLVIYSRLHPYIKILQKVLGTVKNLADTPAGSQRRGSSRKVEGKLVKCVGCGTWVPVDRALGARGLSAYCSSECLEKSSEANRRKAAS